MSVRVKPFAILAAGLAAAGAVTAAAAGQGFDWGLPPGVPPPPVPADNPMTPEKVELGHRLFYEPALSRNSAMSCGACHQQHRAFSEILATHSGVDGSPGKRNAPPLTNVAYHSPLTWADPTAKTLEDQAVNPIFGEHPVEMGMAGREAEVVRRLSADACYRAQFAAAFPEDGGAITIDNIARAIASFQRTLISFEAPYDRARRGEAVTISERARQGEAVFREKGCASCHGGLNFTDYQYYDIGLPAASRDQGLAEKTGRKRDQNRFRTPSLRNVAVTGPFMHDGSIASLTSAILAHRKDRNGRPAPALTEIEAADIVHFLETLTDEAFIKGERFARLADRCEARQAAAD